MSHNAEEIVGYGTTSGDNLWAVYDSSGVIKGYIDISGNFTAVGTLNGTGGTISNPTFTGTVTAAAANFSGAVAITGATTLTGGLATTGVGPGVLPKAQVIQVGAVAYGSLGTDTALQNNKAFISSIFIPRNCTLTGIGILNGTVDTTDKYVGVLWDSTGAVVKNTSTSGTVVAGTDAFQEIAFTATVAVTGPALYYVGVQANGTHAKIRTIAASTYLGIATQLPTVTFGTVAAITPPTTFTAGIGLIAYVY